MERVARSGCREISLFVLCKTYSRRRKKPFMLLVPVNITGFWSEQKAGGDSGPLRSDSSKKWNCWKRWRYSPNGEGIWLLVQSDRLPEERNFTWALQRNTQGCTGHSHVLFDKCATYKTNKTCSKKTVPQTMKCRTSISSSRSVWLVATLQPVAQQMVVILTGYSVNQKRGAATHGEQRFSFLWSLLPLAEFELQSTPRQKRNA